MLSPLVRYCAFPSQKGLLCQPFRVAMECCWSAHLPVFWKVKLALSLLVFLSGAGQRVNVPPPAPHALHPLMLPSSLSDCLLCGSPPWLLTSEAWLIPPPSSASSREPLRFTAYPWGFSSSTPLKSPISWVTGGSSAGTLSNFWWDWQPVNTFLKVSRLSHKDIRSDTEVGKGCY